MRTRFPIIGVLGGMGPLATVDFMAKVIQRTPAQQDQDHPPMIVHSLGETPPRTEAILDGGPSPEPDLVDGVRFLSDAGAAFIAIPCNTAHYWYEPMQAATDVPILHIADAALELAASGGAALKKVGVLSTSGTMASGIYRQRIEARGIETLEPDEATQTALVTGGIAHVKAGDVPAAQGLLAQAAERLLDAGAEAVILGCTEIPVALNADHPLAPQLTDATDALAAATVERALAGEDKTAVA